MTLQTPRLPSELLHQTIGNFNKATSLHDLNALCLASERFRAIAQPRLFETLRLSTLPLPNREPRRAEGILQLFASRPESRNWTSEITVYGTEGALVSAHPSTTDQESEETPDQDAAVRSVFLQMSGLQRIELLYFNLTSKMYSHLYYLQHLEEISLVGLSVAETPEITDRALPLIKLSIQRCLEKDDESVVMNAYRALICPSLQTLTLDLRTADIIFRYLACNPSLTFPSLQFFNFHPSPEALPNLRSLLAFLRSCPNLFRFVLPANCIPYQGSPSDHGKGLAYQEDARDCAPKMSSIHAPADLVRLLLPGRPIGDVDAFLNPKSPLPLDESGLESYRRGAVPLKKLSLGAVTWTQKSLEVLARLFPDLELLSLRVLGGCLSDWHNGDLGRLIGAFKLLDSFAIVPLDDYDELWEGSETAEKERKILTHAEEHGSLITYMCLGQHDIWTKRADGTWESRFETSQSKLRSWLIPSWPRWSAE